jgi:tRNA-dihydrouridine synthase B
MVGRGILGHPWLVGQIASRLSGEIPGEPSLAEREQTIRRHLALSVDFYGELIGTRDFRKHLLWYTKGLRGGAQFRQAAGSISDLDTAMSVLGDYFRSLADPPQHFSLPGVKSE